MSEKLNLEDFKNIVSEYDTERENQFTLDEILNGYNKNEKTEIEYSNTEIKNEKKQSTVIESDVSKPDGISITGAFEAIRKEKASEKIQISIPEIQPEKFKAEELDVDLPENKESVEIKSEIDNKRFFNTETFESIKNKNTEGLKNSMTSFAKGEEEQDDGEEEQDFFTPVEPTEEIDDFENPEEREDVLRELRKLNSSASFKSILTFFLTLFLAVMFLISHFNISLPGISLEQNSRIYLIITLAISVIGTFVNINSIINGVVSFVKFRFNINTSLLLVFFFNTILDIVNIVSATPVESIINFDFIYMLLLWFNISSKHMLSKNVLKNFKVASSDGQKTVVDKPVMEEISNDIILETGNGGDIIYASKSNFVTNFIHNSFKDFETCDRKSPLNIFCIIAVFVFAAVIFVLTDSIINSIIYATCALCAVTPLLSTFSFASPVSRNSRNVRKYGGVIVGSNSASELKDAQTLIVDDSDVFNVALNGIRLYGDSLVDDAIIYLNALYRIVGGPLSVLFGNMLGDNITSLPRIDDIYYHDTMGYSALIHSKVFVAGNKALMDHFGIDVDDSEFEIIYQQKSRNVLFVAYDGQLMGVFLLSYTLSHGVRDAFKICDSDQINVAIAERDANINTSMLFSNFEPDDKSLFKIMKFRTSRNCFEKFMPRSETPSILISNTGLKGIAAALHGCKSILFAIKVNNVIKTISSLMGLFLITFLLVFSDPGTALPTHILIYQLLWSLPILFVSLFSK